MKIKKILKNLIVVSMLGSLIFSMSACKGETDVPNGIKDQYINEKYYIQTGVPENWTMQADVNKDYLDTTTGLLFNIYPDTSADSRSPQFSVFHKKNTMIQLTLNGSMDLVKAEFDKSGREGLTQSAPENIFKRKMQYKYVKYDFQKNGETWKGEYYVIIINNGYLILDYEGSAVATDGSTSPFDKYYSEFSKIMEDFRILGFEEEA